MTLTHEQHQSFLRSTADFRSDHEKPLSEVRRIANVPENRFFGVRSNGDVVIDQSRKREVESRKLSKSDQ
jgi:hypothetical protein